MTGDPADKAVDPTVSTLNELIQTCKDGENGFRAAAESVEDSNLRHLLESYAQQRAEFAADLQLEVRRLVEDPVDTGRTTAALQRTWPDTKAGLETKAGLTKRDEATVIAECEQCDDAAVRAYQKSLDSHLPGDLRMIVERQLVEVKEAHDHILSLERSHARIG
jgi:uncharacterized protein (TIGR02284 family)